MSREPRPQSRVAASDSPDAAPAFEQTQRRVVVERISPSVDGGAWPAKRVLGDSLEVGVDLVADSHDVLGGRVWYRAPDDPSWRTVALEHRGNDRHAATFELRALGRTSFFVEGWIDEIASWRSTLERKIGGSEEAEVISHLLQGAVLVESASKRASGGDRAALRIAAKALAAAAADPYAARAVALDDGLLALAARHPDVERASRSAVFEVEVEPVHARFSSWYEFFPRSCGAPGEHGRLRDCDARLRYVAELGFDTVYLPPIHPIGTSFRKGKDNTLVAGPDDPGSPWAIGSGDGGHKAVHPALGTLEDFRWFVGRAGELGLRVALDVALQVSPDHPYVREHPEWFVHRPDGSIQYAENPPKKYQDIYPFDFQCDDAPALWEELASIFRFWIEQGVRTFRVDNPHTKSLEFWRWCIGAIKRDHPDVVFLAEAFTRPKLMYALAKLGFSQSYTYFTWRNTKRELTEYLTELTQTEVAEFFRPNLWPNTPDILPESLQWGGRPTYVQRLVLAATLSASYGIYGPAFELMESEARPGSGEYRHNEKYELRDWDVDRPDSLRDLVRRVNAIRRDSVALQDNRSLRFHGVDNEAILAYSKRAGEDVVVVVVSLDPHYTQGGHVDLDLDALGIDPGAAYQAHDLLGGGRYSWCGARNYVELVPEVSPAQVFRLRRRLRTERDFDYFA